jgi:hypothetical protein
MALRPFKVPGWRGSRHGGRRHGGIIDIVTGMRDEMTLRASA